MKIIKVYSKGIFSNRKKVEAKLFKEGYKIESEEEIKEWDGGQACCLAIIFLPLIFFGKVKKVRVTYIKNG
jgi:regulator of RNase E activity RraB